MISGAILLALGTLLIPTVELNYLNGLILEMILAKTDSDEAEHQVTEQKNLSGQGYR